MFYKKVALKNFAKFTGKRGLQLYEKRGSFDHCFPVNFANFLRTAFFTEHPLTTASVFHKEKSTRVMVIAEGFHDFMTQHLSRKLRSFPRYKY